MPPVRARVRFGWVSKKYWYVLARVTVVAIPCRRVLIVLEQGMPNNGTKQISHDIIQEVISRDQNASLISTASLDTCLPPLPCPTVPLSFSHSPSSLLSAPSPSTRCPHATTSAARQTHLESRCPRQHPVSTQAYFVVCHIWFPENAGEQGGAIVDLARLTAVEGNKLSRIGGAAPAENHPAFIELDSGVLILRGVESQ